MRTVPAHAASRPWTKDENRGKEGIDAMKKRWMLACLISAILTGQVVAQRPAAPRRESRPGRAARVAPREAESYYAPRVTGYDDPATAVRRKAAFRAAQRMQRIAALRWYGMSKSRPMASSTPWASTYSPTWTSNTRRPYAWRGSGRTALIVR